MSEMEWSVVLVEWMKRNNFKVVRSYGDKQEWRVQRKYMWVKLKFLGGEEG